ncbi:MAG: hypothetical protein ABI266_01060 [Ginsengibacter sp.]
MNETINSSNYLYNKFDDVSSLERTVKNHPLSSFARFLLLKQYQKTKRSLFGDYALQSSLYFNNPQWLSFQLLREEWQEMENGQDAEIVDVSEAEKVLTGNSIENNVEGLKNNSEGEVPESGLEEGEINVGQIIPVDGASEFSLIENKSLGDDSSLEVQNPRKLPASVHSVSNDLTKVVIPADPGKKVEEPVLSQNEKEELLFEPLHATDYFASLGVTIKEESMLNDKLGAQMKSFSQWLKSMKQLHPNKLPGQNEVIERIIQSSSEQSNVESEVLTEAMAEVLLKQDKRQKAIEMYEKLSLMNPSKSIYFAAKIDKIKNN